MKIAFHSYQLGERGSEICLYKYAKYNREILGNESIIISTSSRPIPCKSRFDEFETILKRYDTYMETTKPVLDFYSKNPNFHEIDGSAEIDEITMKINTLINV